MKTILPIHRHPLLLALFCLLLLNSCVSRKSIAYFQDLQEEQALNTDNNLRIKPDDALTIRVSAPEQKAALPFNLTKAVGGLTEGGSNNAELETYQVSDKGTINFPVLGSLKVEGMTQLELANFLENKLTNFVQDPLVTVRIVNFQISILGEVNSPGTYIIEDDHISLPKALGLAGDVRITGKRQRILVMREKDGTMIHEYVNLTDADILNSSFYNLRQNDIVYVEPTGSRIQSASYLGTASAYLSIASVIVSLILVFTR